MLYSRAALWVDLELQRVQVLYFFLQRCGVAAAKGQASQIKMSRLQMGNAFRHDRIGMNVLSQRLFRLVETSCQVFVFAADKIGLTRKDVGVNQPYIRSGKLPQTFHCLLQFSRQGMIEG